MKRLGIYYVYQFRRPNGVLCYIGVSKRKQRKEEHLRAAKRPAKRKNIFRNIIRKYGAENLLYEVFAGGLTKSEAVALEIRLITRYGRLDLGTGTLANMTCGGDGLVALSDDARKRRAMVLKETLAKPEVKAKKREAALATLRKPGFLERRNKILKAAHLRPDVKERCRVAHADVVWRKGQSTKAKEAYSRPEVKAKHKATRADPKWRANLGKILKAANAKPGVKERRKVAVKQAMGRSDVVAKLKAAGIRYSARWENDLDFRKKTCAAMSAGWVKWREKHGKPPKPK
jgi:hypothetical protein